MTKNNLWIIGAIVSSIIVSSMIQKQNEKMNNEEDELVKKTTDEFMKGVNYEKDKNN